MHLIRGIDERLANFPDLRQRVEQLLDIVEGQQGEILKADEVEQFVDQHLRSLGQELIHNWAQTQSYRQQKAWSQRPGVSKKEKKLYGG
jgi:hypothetical protein